MTSSDTKKAIITKKIIDINTMIAADFMGITIQLNEYQYGVLPKVNKKQGSLVLKTDPVLATSVSIYAVNTETSLPHLQCA